MGSRNIRRADRPVHREDVVAAARDVVATPSRSHGTDIHGVEGFRVDGPDGRIGTVASVSSSTAGASLDTIHVVTGLFIVRVVAVPAPEIVHIDGDQRRIVVRAMIRRPRTPQVHGMLRRFLASTGPG